MLKDLLEQKNCFKLICGAGNENLEEVEKLVALYAKAGCHFFDLSANEEVLKTAKHGLDFVVPEYKQKNYHFCISIGTKNDQHMQKAKINNQLCTKCGKCINICPQNGINKNFTVSEEKCIGCLKCEQICKSNAIDTYSKIQPINLDILTTNFPQLSCIELHASDTDENEINIMWQYLNKNFDGMLSLCLGRATSSNEQIINRIKQLIKDRKPYTTIIQADGSPMSGGKDDYKTTLQAVAMAELIQNENLPIYLLLSGGTNSKTAQLANLCEVDFNGIALGSYARKIVKDYIKREDFFTNQVVFDEAATHINNIVNYKNQSNICVKAH